MEVPDPWYVVKNLSLEDFVLGMLKLGKPFETSLVGIFDDKGRGSRRDIELTPHYDGEYSFKSVPRDQVKIDFVGLYCIRGGGDCLTTIHSNDGNEIGAVNLQPGEALVFDNRKVLHGRRGKVAKNRLLMRLWITE